MAVAAMAAATIHQSGYGSISDLRIISQNLMERQTDTNTMHVKYMNNCEQNESNLLGAVAAVCTFYLEHSTMCSCCVSFARRLFTLATASHTVSH